LLVTCLHRVTNFFSDPGVKPTRDQPSPAPGPSQRSRHHATILSAIQAAHGKRYPCQGNYRAQLKIVCEKLSMSLSFAEAEVDGSPFAFACEIDGETFSPGGGESKNKAKELAAQYLARCGTARAPNLLKL